MLLLCCSLFLDYSDFQLLFCLPGKTIKVYSISVECFMNCIISNKANISRFSTHMGIIVGWWCIGSCLVSHAGGSEFKAQ